MTREQAIAWINEVQDGDGVDRTKFPEEMKGAMAKQLWDDAVFTYGIEYGVIIALLKVFGITREELNE